jgi:uncharacterized protein YkwD
MPRIIRRAGFIIVVATLVQGCTLIGPSPAEVATEMGFCVDEVNRYRALADLPALARSEVLESFAAESARIDGEANRPHRHFTDTNGAGIARAETELLAWKNGSVHRVIEQGLALMWSEGPDGEHIRILAGPYTQLGCGLSINSNGVTVAQDFR